MKWECSTTLAIRLAAYNVMEYWQEVIKASTSNTSTPPHEQRKSMSSCTSLASTAIVNTPTKSPLQVGHSAKSAGMKGITEKIVVNTVANSVGTKGRTEKTLVIQGNKELAKPPLRVSHYGSPSFIITSIRICFWEDSSLRNNFDKLVDMRNTKVGEEKQLSQMFLQP